MNPIDRFIKKLSILFGQERFSSELDEEMAFHREQVERELIADGMTSEAAHYAARRRFGNTTKLREQSHEVVSFRAETLAQDLRFGFRQWTKNPGFALTAIFMTSFILLPANAVWALFTLEYLRALAFAPTIPLLWAMFADVADYAEWRTGRRTTGVIYATIIFGLKAGLSLGGAMAGKLLKLYGYIPNVPQTAKALLGIRLTVSVYPAIFFFIVVVCMFFYKISKKLNIQIQDELAERRKKFQAIAATPGEN